MTHVLAIDLGASGGRVIRGSWDASKKKISLTNIHRFANEPVEVRGTLHWDILRLFHEIKVGIRKATRELPTGESIACLGVDTWGVDFGLLDRRGRLLGNPVHYRDKRTDGQLARLDKILGEGILFRRTGVQNAWFNTIGQLTGALAAEPEFFDGAEAVLFTPDLLNYFLTGIKVTERTIGSTSQLMVAGRADWDTELLDSLGLPRGLLQPVREPGALLGPVADDIATDLGLPLRTPVALIPSHDTEAAVVAVPASAGMPFAFVSCGTWAVLGAELGDPLLTDSARLGGFSNEASAGGKTLLVKNIMGMWLLQECKRWWERDGEVISHAELVDWAEAAPSWKSVIDVNHRLFSSPGDLPGRIQAYCRETGQEIPETRGAIVRSVLESLACEFRRSLRDLESVCGTTFPQFWLVGGGVQNQLLCQLTASVTGRTVHIGSTETTALGNVASQLMALGVFSSLAETRLRLATSFGVGSHAPDGDPQSESGYRRWLEVVEGIV